MWCGGVTRSNGQKRSFSTLIRVLSVFDREDLDAVYKLVMDIYQDKIPEGFDKVLWGDLIVMFNPDEQDEFWNSQHTEIIKEYLVKVNKRRAFWSLNEDILKINDSDYQYAVSIKKIRRIRACTHQRPRRKQDQYAVSREDQYAVLEI
ncbi:hypothetical protein Tco_1103129 [Tanacetum coccineum]